MKNSPEAFKPEQKAVDTRLSEEEAHEEANMLRASLGINPESGKIIRETRGFLPWQKHFEHLEPTAEDYDRALESVQELRKLSEEEPEVEKALYKVGRVIQRGGQILNLALVSVGFIIGPPRHFADFLDYQRANRQKLADAEKRLQDLKKSGKKFAKGELKTAKGIPEAKE